MDQVGRVALLVRLGLSRKEAAAGIATGVLPSVWLSLQSLEAGLEKLIRQELLDLASASVRERVAPKTWDAFWLVT